MGSSLEFVKKETNFTTSQPHTAVVVHFILKGGSGESSCLLPI